MRTRKSMTQYPVNISPCNDTTLHSDKDLAVSLQAFLPGSSSQNMRMVQSLQIEPSLFAPRASRRLGITQYLLPLSLLREKRASVRTFLTPILTRKRGNPTCPGKEPQNLIIHLFCKKVKKKRPVVQAVFYHKISLSEDTYWCNSPPSRSLTADTIRSNALSIS